MQSSLAICLCHCCHPPDQPCRAAAYAMSAICGLLELEKHQGLCTQQMFRQAGFTCTAKHDRRAKMQYMCTRWKQPFLAVACKEAKAACCTGCRVITSLQTYNAASAMPAWCIWSKPLSQMLSQRPARRQSGLQATTLVSTSQQQHVDTAS